MLFVSGLNDVNDSYVQTFKKKNKNNFQCQWKWNLFTKEFVLNVFFPSFPQKVEKYSNNLTLKKKKKIKQNFLEREKNMKILKAL